MSLARTLAEISAERARQDAKWGEQNHPDGTGPYTRFVFSTMNDHAISCRNRTQRAADAGTLTWTLIFLEEVFEALAEDDPAKMRAELVQVAAVAAAWIEAIDRRAGAS